MPDDAEEHLQPIYSASRRLAMFSKLIEEGLIVDKPPEQITEVDLDAINGRLFLEDKAAVDGISVDEMIDGWEAELATATKYSSLDEFMDMLGRPALTPNK